MPSKLRQQRKLTKSEQLKFTIDCSTPFKDSIINPANFEKFLTDTMKVNGKKGNLGGNVTISVKDARFTVTSNVAMSKRYLKYLTKKYLKKEQLRDYLRVVADSKDSYKVAYYKMNDDKEDDDEENEDDEDDE